MQVVERPLKMSQALMMFVRRDGAVALFVPVLRRSGADSLSRLALLVAGGHVV